jgi:hypothetical protein
MSNVPKGTRGFASLMAIGALAIAAAPVSASLRPRLTKVGAYVVRYDGPEARAALSYRIAAHSVGAPYLILQLAVSGAGYSAVEVPRDKVGVVTADGTELDLMSEKDFLDNFSAIRDVSLAAGYGDPVTGYFAHVVQESDLHFFLGPYDTGVTYQEVEVNDRREAYGPLYFEVPGDVQKGKWVLQFRAGTRQVRIPFEL